MTSRISGVVCLLVSLAFTQGCMDDESEFEKQRKRDEQAIADYLANNQIEAERSPAGFYYIKTASNDSGKEVKSSDVLSIYYDMSLLSGSKVGGVDDATGNGQPVKFLYTSSRYTLAPTGLNLGVGLMREGESFRFFIPAYLAFGSYSYKSLIPVHANFIIDVDLVEIDNANSQKAIEKEAIENYVAEKNWDDAQIYSSGLAYKKLTDGEGDTPKNGDVVTISFTGTYLDGTVFDKSETGKPISLTIGNDSVIEGFEQGMKFMQKGEEAIVIVPSHLAYGANVETIPEEVREAWLTRQQINNHILPYSTLIFEVKLENIK